MITLFPIDCNCGNIDGDPLDPARDPETGAFNLVDTPPKLKAQAFAIFVDGVKPSSNPAYRGPMGIFEGYGDEPKKDEPGIPECCDLGDDVKVTEDHDPNGPWFLGINADGSGCGPEGGDLTDEEVIATYAMREDQHFSDAEADHLNKVADRLNEVADRLEMQDMPHSWQSERILSAQSASDMAKEDYSEVCINCGSPKCLGDCDDEDLTEDQRMGQAGASDEEIATAKHIESLYVEVEKARDSVKHLNACNEQLAEARDSVASLLKRIDNLCGPDLHCLGSTPSWYVEAAAIACGIKIH